MVESSSLLPQEITAAEGFASAANADDIINADVINAWFNYRDDLTMFVFQRSP